MEHQFEEAEKKSDKKLSFFCGLCLRSVKMLNHETTRTHIKKLEMLDQMQKVILEEKELVMPHCSICLKICSSQNQLNYHLRKERHKSSLNKYIKYFIKENNLNNRIFSYNSCSDRQKSIVGLNRDCQAIYNIVKNTENFDFIKYEFERNEALFENLIKFIRSNDSIINASEDKDAAFDALMMNNNLQGFIAKKTIGDGNCFYRTVSYQLFNTECYYEFIKACLTYLLIKNENRFKIYIKDACQSDICNYLFVLYL